MVTVLVILDGASEPPGRETSLDRARTPTLDRLAGEGRLRRLRTVPDRLSAGSEIAIPTLLGWAPTAPVCRGAIEAAAHEVPVFDGHRAWRVDLLERDGRRADDRRTRGVVSALAARVRGHSVRWLRGHRMLVTGPPPLPDAARDVGLRPWPLGAVPPRILDSRTVVIAARGAAAGIGRLMGARVVIPPGATGQPNTDLGAKADAVSAAIAGGADRVVVHVGGPDEAAHRCDAREKVAAIERIDRDLIEPVAGVVSRAGGTLRVCPDHSCDPRTGEHGGEPVPQLEWRPGRGARVRRRLTERAVAELPVVDA